jgi:hypothetical protein
MTSFLKLIESEGRHPENLDQGPTTPCKRFSLSQADNGRFSMQIEGEGCLNANLDDGPMQSSS